MSLGKDENRRGKTSAWGCDLGIGIWDGLGYVAGLGWAGDTDRYLKQEGVRE